MLRLDRGGGGCSGACTFRPGRSRTLPDGINRARPVGKFDLGKAIRWNNSPVQPEPDCSRRNPTFRCNSRVLLADGPRNPAAKVFQFRTFPVTGATGLPVTHPLWQRRYRISVWRTKEVDMVGHEVLRDF